MTLDEEQMEKSPACQVLLMGERSHLTRFSSREEILITFNQLLEKCPSLITFFSPMKKQLYIFM